MSPAAVTGDRYYRGIRSAPGYVQVTIHEPGSGWSQPLVPFVRHSPLGFEWGEVCPGAADLARALIIDAAGAAALCEGCNGSKMVVLDPAWQGDPEHEPSRPYHSARDAQLPPEQVAECTCGDGIRQLPYRDFEYAVVAQWHDDTWSIARSAVLEELTTFYPPGAVPGWLHAVVTGAAVT